MNDYPYDYLNSFNKSDYNYNPTWYNNFINNSSSSLSSSSSSSSSSSENPFDYLYNLLYSGWQDMNKVEGEAFKSTKNWVDTFWTNAANSDINLFTNDIAKPTEKAVSSGYKTTSNFITKDIVKPIENTAESGWGDISGFFSNDIAKPVETFFSGHIFIIIVIGILLLVILVKN